MGDMLAAQVAIRQQAEEQQESLAELASWTTSIKKKDDKLRVVPSPVASTRPSVTGPSSAVSRGPSNSAADHTYDRGYRKWETFDVDAALGAEGNVGDTAQNPQMNSGIPASQRPQNAKPRAAVQKPVAVVNPATAARENGNACFKRGDYAGAISAYTLSLTTDPQR
jgi:hypothetical protein